MEALINRDLLFFAKNTERKVFDKTIKFLNTLDLRSIQLNK
jgi:hypothetical protein